MGGNERPGSTPGLGAFRVVLGGRWSELVTSVTTGDQVTQQVFRERIPSRISERRSLASHWRLVS